MNPETLSDTAWCMRYNHYDPKDEGRREALLALGNGYVVSRAAAPDSRDDGTHYPGTYRVGCYNRLSTQIEDLAVENESLVNLPNWLPLSFRIEAEPWFSLDKVALLSYRQELNLQQALLSREILFRDGAGRKTRLRERRFVSMNNPHLMALELELTPENWSGRLEVRSGLDGRVCNNNVARYAPLNKQHLQILFAKPLGTESLELKARTVHSGIEIALAARTRLKRNGQTLTPEGTLETEEAAIAQRFALEVAQGEPLLIEKIATLYTSQDLAIAECCEAAHIALQRAPDFSTLFKAHCLDWHRLWQHCLLELEDPEQLLYFRLHMFQILQNISPHTTDGDVGVPPSGWQGEEYHGQIFWDELFIFPFLTFRFPGIARSALRYRYRRLAEARVMARKEGLRGAMFPWRSASTGREETPLLQYNLLSGHWLEDNTFLQRHINAIIAFNINQYVEISGDLEFLFEFGAELFLEIARFWASTAEYNQQLERYEISGVVGPDEYHTKYPGAQRAGIKNNTYTNVLAAWTLRQARRVYEQLPAQRQQELCKQLGIHQTELEQWEEISKKMRIVLQQDGLLGQFEGFDRLREFDLEQYRKEWGQQRIDWTLESIGDSIEKYKVSKQADFSLLLYLFSPHELQELLAHMGYTISFDTLRRSLNHHIDHSAHESSLSRIVHAAALSTFDLEASWSLFQEAQLIDLLPDEDSDSSEGIHLGAMGGTISVLQHQYLRIKADEGVLQFAPELPPALEQLKIALKYRGVAICCTLSSAELLIHSINKKAAPIRVGYKQAYQTLQPGSTVRFMR